MAAFGSESDNSEDFVTLLVGPKEDRYTVSAELLARESTVFKNELEEQLRDDYEKTFRIENEQSTLFDPIVFSFFIYWLKHDRHFPVRTWDAEGRTEHYAETVNEETEKDDQDADANYAKLLFHWQGLKGLIPNPGHFVDLYLLGEKYDIKALRNECIVALCELMKYSGDAKPSMAYIEKAFQNLDTNSSLWQLLLRILLLWTPWVTPSWCDTTGNILLLRELCRSIGTICADGRGQHNFRVDARNFLEN